MSNFIINVDAFNGKHFLMWCRPNSVDWNMCQSVMKEDAYRLSLFPLKNGMTAIDLGAHIGTVSIMLASYGLNVYAVEPLPENVDLLNKNIIVNGLQNKIKVYPYAVASKSNHVMQIGYQVEDVHKFIGVPIVSDAMLKYRSGCSHFVGVKTITLEDIFIENNIDRCNFMKVDIEGGEWDVFKHVPEQILEKIDVIVGELHAVDKVVDHSSLLPYLKGYFNDASMVYQALDNSVGKARCDEVGGISNFVYIRKGLPIPL